MTQEFWTGRQGWLALALLSFSCYIAFQGTRGLDNASEGRYAECARAMTASGDYITPTLNGLPHWTKPPLGYWVPALGIELFGVNAWGARIGNALIGAFTVLLVAGAARAFWGNAVGFAAGWIYLSSPFPFFGAHVVTVDALLTACVVAAVWCYAEARRAPRLGWVLGFWLACGLGFMTKGPLVFVPLVPLMVWHWRSGQGFRLFHPIGLVVFLISGGWWFAVIFIKHPELFNYYLREELAARMTGSVNDDSTHNRQFYKPFIMYLPVLTVGAGAWIYYGLRLIAERELWRPKKLWAEMKSTGMGGMLLTWLLLPLVLFFVSKSRLHLYVLPLFPAVAMACAVELLRRNGGLFPTRKVLTISLATLAVLVSAKAAVGFMPRSENMEPMFARLQQMPDFTTTQVVAFEKSDVYALKFYLKGQLRHATFEDKKEAWEERIEDVIDEIKKAPPEKHWAFVGDKKKVGPLAERLEAMGFAFEAADVKKWRILRVVKKPAA